MGEAFKASQPLIDVAVHDGKSGDDERDGFQAIFRGAMIGIRNPRAHELFEAGDPQQALEYLGLASCCTVESTLQAGKATAGLADQPKAIATFVGKTT